MWGILNTQRPPTQRYFELASPPLLILALDVAYNAYANVQKAINDSMSIESNFICTYNAD